MRATLSILGLYRVRPDIFDEMYIPDEIDAETLKDNILLECAELETAYTDADFVKRAIKLWSNKERYNWDELVKTLHYEYNPIWNKDGTITENVSESGTSNGTGSGSESLGVAAFNSDKIEPKEQRTSTGTSNAASNVERTTSRTESGNIGVTSTQSLIKEQREIVLFNIYDKITESFKKAFCLMVY